MSGREFTNWRGLSPPPRFALMQFSRSVRCTVYQASSRGYDWRSGLGGRRGKSLGCTLHYALENENAKQWIDTGRAKQRGSRRTTLSAQHLLYNLLALFRKGTKIYAKKVATFPFASPPPIIAILFFFALKVRTDSHADALRESLPSICLDQVCPAAFLCFLLWLFRAPLAPVLSTAATHAHGCSRGGRERGRANIFSCSSPSSSKVGERNRTYALAQGRRGEKRPRGGKKKRREEGPRGRRSCSPRGGERNFHLPSGGCRYKKVKGSGIRDFAPPPRPLFANRKSGGERERLTSRFLFFPFYVHEFA